MIRTQKIPFIQSTASVPVLLLTACIMIIGIYIPFSPLGAAVGLQALPLSYFPWLVGILLGYAFLTQFLKNLYIKSFIAGYKNENERVLPAHSQKHNLDLYVWR